MKRWKAYVPGVCAAIALAAPSAHADAVSGAAANLASQLVTAPEVQNKQRTSRGFSLIRAGRPQQAIMEFDAVIASADQQYSRDPRPRLCAADEAKARQFASAAGEEAVLIDPAVCDAHFGKGFALVDLGKGNLAEAELRRATELAPYEPHYFNEYAELFKSRREWQKSYDLFARAWAVVDKDKSGADSRMAARALRGMGYSRIGLGQLDEAEKLFRQSQEYEPDSEAARIEIGFIARKKAIGS